MSTTMDTGDQIGGIETLRRGVHYSPELKEGFVGTLLLAFVASIGQVVVPIPVQRTVDHGINAPGGPDISYVVEIGLAAAVAILGSAFASYALTRRPLTTSEPGRATLRVSAFRHVPDLPLLTQNPERRGALVSRVTS